MRSATFAIIVAQSIVVVVGAAVAVVAQAVKHVKRPRERGQQKSLPTTSRGQRHHQRHLSLALASSTCYAGHEMRSGAKRGGWGAEEAQGPVLLRLWLGFLVLLLTQVQCDALVRRLTFVTGATPPSPHASLCRRLPFNFNSFSFSNSPARYSSLLIELCIIYCIFILVFPSCCHKLRFHIKMSRGM